MRAGFSFFPNCGLSARRALRSASLSSGKCSYNLCPERLWSPQSFLGQRVPPVLHRVVVWSSRLSRSHAWLGVPTAEGSVGMVERCWSGLSTSGHQLQQKRLWRRAQPKWQHRVDIQGLLPHAPVPRVDRYASLRSSFAIRVPAPSRLMIWAATSTEVYLMEHCALSRPAFTLWPSGDDKSTMRRHLSGWLYF